MGRTVRINPIILCITANLSAALITGVKGSGWICQIGSYNLWATDIAVLLSVPAIVLALRKPSPMTLPKAILAVYLALEALALLRGVAEYGLSEAANAFRWHAAFCTTLIAIAYGRPDKRAIQQILSAFIWLATIFSAVVFARLLIGNTFLQGGSQYDGFYAGDGRPLLQQATLLVSEGAVFSLWGLLDSLQRGVRRRGWRLAQPLVLLLALAASGQRTASIGGLAALGFLLLTDGKRIRATNVVAMIFLAVFGLYSVWLMAISTSPDVLFGMLPKEVQSAFDPHSTLVAREYIWQSISQQFSTWSVVNQAIGQPSGYIMFVDLVHLNLHMRLGAHNEYLSVLIAVGFVGAVALFIAVALVFFHTLYKLFFEGRPTKPSGLPPALIASLIIVLIIFGVSYDWQWEQGIIVGLCFLRV